MTLSDWMPQEPDFELYHIYSHQKDYRLCYALNNYFKFNFTRIKDFLEEESNPHLPTYSHFQHTDNITHKEYFIISNQPLVKELVTKEGDLFATEQPELLIPTLAKVDYFLLLYGQFTEQELDLMEDQLNLVPFINAAKRIDPSSNPAYLNLMH